MNNTSLESNSELKKTYTVTDNTIVDLFTSQAEIVPDAVAARFKERVLTYKELNTLSDRLASLLKSFGVGKETMVPFLLDYSINIPVAIMGILKAGAAFVPLDVDFPEGRIKYMLDDCDCKVIISNANNIDGLLYSNYKVIFIEDVYKLNDTELTITEPYLPSLSDLAYVIYTSGSTGKPKGVMVEHAQIINYITGVYNIFELECCNSYGVLGTFSADAAYTAVFAALCFGKTLDIINIKSFTSFEALSHHLSKYPIDCYKTTPSIAGLLLEYKAADNILPRKRMILGGEACPVNLAVDLHKLLPAGCRLFNHYGPTETTIGVITYRFPDSFSEIPDKIPLGKPLPNVRVHFLDDQLQPVKTNETGEIYIEGPLVARGYLNKPETTAEKFITIPLEGNTVRLYRTGDLGVLLDNGNIDYIGRNDDQVKINGNRIELKEIENVILSFKMVKQCVVVLSESKTGLKTLAAYLVVNELYDQSKLIALLKGKLPEFMIPNRFICLPELPLTVNNKINKLALPDAFLDDSNTEDSSVLVRGETLSYLTDLWKALLGISKIDDEDQFFDLGGNSFLLIKLAFNINSRFKTNITSLDLLNHPTLSSLCAFIKQKQTEAPVNSNLIPEGFDPYEASFSQKNFFIKNKLNPSDPFPNSNITFKINGVLDINKLERACVETITEHEGLYTTFKLKKRVLYKEFNNVESIAINYATGENINQAIASVTWPFNFSQPPLLRLFIVELADKNKYLHIDMPHINSDGHTLQILIKSIVNHYNGNQKHKVVYQFSDFQRNTYLYKQSAQFNEDRKYWAGEISAYKPLEYFKCHFQDANPLAIGGYSYVDTLDGSTFDKISAFLAGKNMSRFQFFFISYAIYLKWFLKANFLPILLPVANRNKDGFDEIIGMLSNVALVNLEIDPGLNIRQLFEKCQTKTIEVLSHQEFPYAEVIGMFTDNKIFNTDLPSLYFGYHNIVPEFAPDDATLSFHLPQRDRENMPLSISVYDVKDKISLRISSKPQCYNRTELGEIANGYFTLVDKILSTDQESSITEIMQNMDAGNVADTLKVNE